MVKIDPMNYLINTILDYKEAVIFLGGGASMEGKQDKKRFPGYDDLIDRILQKFGIKPKSKRERLHSFFSIIEQWEKEKRLALRLREFLDGEPGLAHYHLAALSIALYGESNTLLYLTKNFDDLINQAFKDLQKNPVRKFKPVFIPIHPNLHDSEFQEIFINMEANLDRGCPVILKLFGDLNFPKPILRQEDIKFQPKVEEKLIEWMKKPMIVIGYSFSDKILRELLIASRGSSPIFLINPFKKIPSDIKVLDRVHHIKLSFHDCLNRLLEIIQERNPSINRKVERILEFLDPILFYPDFNSIKNRINKCSKASLLRAEEGIPKIEVNGKGRKLILIPRKNTSPDFNHFINQERPLLSVIGDSGTGKSTQFYQIASQNEMNSQFITLFYDAHHLQIPGSLTKKLIQDFKCRADQLEDLLLHFDKSLTSENKKMLILIDGLNESIQVEPLSLKADIEDLGGKLTSISSIKIAYSCRKVYWETYIKVNFPLPSELYFGSKEFILYHFSDNEAKLAFREYQKAYKFTGTYELLKDEFKKKIRDPLMLRMLAEGYEGKELPSFAPAVFIFEKYETVLRNKLRNTVLMDFIDELISLKLDDVKKNPNVSDQFISRDIRTNERLSRLIEQQLKNPSKKGDPLILLEDEGIIKALGEDKTIYRFTYDRFFEYLLGKAIGNHIDFSNRENFITSLSENISKFYLIHFSFLQALKSEIVRRNINDPKGIWSIYDVSSLKLLLKNSDNTDITVVNFVKDVLRELTFESEVNTIDALKGITDNEMEWKLLALDIAGDSPKIMPILISGLFSGEKHFTRRCIQILSVINEAPDTRKTFESSVISELRNCSEFKREYAMGLIYYTSTIFYLEDRMGNDPIGQVKIFWKAALVALQAANHSLRNVKNVIKFEFIRVLKDEGPLFFADEARDAGMDYLWTGMTKKERELAQKMLPLLINSDKPIDDEAFEILLFFGSELKDWEKRNKPEENQLFVYTFEYKIAEWILILRSQTKFDEVKNILERFVDTGFWVSVDFALCNMRFTLRATPGSNKKRINDGYSYLKRWTEKFEKEDPIFFDALKEENKDPFNVNFIPIANAAIIEVLHFTPKEGPIKILEERLRSPDPKKVQLALLATRYLWGEHPKKVLGTLEAIVDSKDEVVINWLNKILKEIYLIYPGLVEEFFWRNRMHMSQSRIHTIKFMTDVVDAVGFEHDGGPLYKALFLRSKERRILFAEWYKKLLESSSYEDFCDEFIDYLFNEILDLSR